MSIVAEDIQSKTIWFNKQLCLVKDNFIKWLQEIGHEVVTTDKSTKIIEGLGGEYDTKEYTILIDKNISVKIIPYGIWIIGARGRIDIYGPSGSEKLLYFRMGDKIVMNVDEDGWYWDDNSPHRRVLKFSKDIVISLLERLQ